MTTAQTISTSLDQSVQAATPDSVTDDPRLLVQAFQQRLRTELLSTAAEQAAGPSCGRRALAVCRSVAAKADGWLARHQPNLTPGLAQIES